MCEDLTSGAGEKKYWFLLGKITRFFYRSSVLKHQRSRLRGSDFWALVVESLTQGRKEGGRAIAKKPKRGTYTAGLFEGNARAS